MPPHELIGRAEGIVVWSPAELAAAVDAAVSRKRVRFARWPARVRARYASAVLLLVLDERQRLEGDPPEIEAAAPFDEIAIVALEAGGARVVARSAREAREMP